MEPESGSLMSRGNDWQVKAILQVRPVDSGVLGAWDLRCEDSEDGDGAVALRLSQLVEGRMPDSLYFAGVAQSLDDVFVYRRF